MQKPVSIVDSLLIHEARVDKRTHFRTRHVPELGSALAAPKDLAARRQRRDAVEALNRCKLTCAALIDEKVVVPHGVT